MAKTKTYTVPLTLRLSPGMMQYVDEQAREKGLTAVDWVRFAIAFTYWEEEFLEHIAEEEKKVGSYDPIDYAPAFENMCQELEDPNSQVNLQRKHRQAIIEERRRRPRR